MNDSETVDVVRDSLTRAKDSLAGIHVNTPLDAIVRNGRARRRRHRLTGLTGAMAVTAGLALAVTALVKGQCREPHRNRRPREIVVALLARSGPVQHHQAGVCGAIIG